MHQGKVLPKPSAYFSVFPLRFCAFAGRFLSGAGGVTWRGFDEALNYLGDLR